MLYPGALSSTPIFRARKARSWPTRSVTGSASAVVSNGIVAGSQRHRSFSGGNPASKVMGLVAIVEFARSVTGFRSFHQSVSRRVTLAQARRRAHRSPSGNFHLPQRVRKPIRKFQMRGANRWAHHRTRGPPACSPRHRCPNTRPECQRRSPQRPVPGQRPSTPNTAIPPSTLMNTSNPFSEARPPSSTGRKILSIVAPIAAANGDQNDGAPRMPRRKQPDRRGNPHRPRAHHRKKRQKCHHHAPEHRRTQSHDRKRPAANRSLDRRNHQARRDARENQFAGLASIRSRIVSSNGRKSRKRARIESPSRRK